MKLFLPKKIKQKSLILILILLICSTFSTKNTLFAQNKQICEDALANFEKAKTIFEENKTDKKNLMSALSAAHKALKYHSHCLPKSQQKCDVYTLRSEIYKALGSEKSIENAEKDAMVALKYCNYVVEKQPQSESKLKPNKPENGYGKAPVSKIKKPKHRLRKDVAVDDNELPKIEQSNDNEPPKEVVLTVPEDQPIDTVEPKIELPKEQVVEKKQEQQPIEIVIEQPPSLEEESIQQNPKQEAGDICQSANARYTSIKPNYAKIKQLRDPDERRVEFEQLLAEFRALDDQLQGAYLKNQEPYCKKLTGVVCYYIGAISFKLDDCETAREYLTLSLTLDPDLATKVTNGLAILKRKCQQPEISFVWLAPRPDGGQYNTAENELALSVNIASNYPLDVPNVVTLVNNQPAQTAGRKSDRRPRVLTPIDNPNGDTTVYHYEYNYFPLFTASGRHEVNVQVQLEEYNFAQTMTKPLIVNYQPPDIPTNTLKILNIGPSSDLQYPQKDAADFADIFTQGHQEGEDKLYQKITIQSLLGKQATATNIMRALEDQQTVTDDLLIVHISAHGSAHQDELYIQGSDYEYGRYKSTAIQYQDIIDLFSAQKTQTLLLIDACHSGDDGFGAAPNFINGQAPITVFVSSHANESSYEDPHWENGAFTEAIIQALSDRQADQSNDQAITVNELIEYVTNNVPQMVRQVKGQGVQQHPVTIENQIGETIIYQFR